MHWRRSEISTKLNQDKFFYHSPESPLVAVYDDWFYSRNDYDHLCPKQRNYITKFLQEIEATRLSGSHYRLDNYTFGVIKSLNLGVSPLDEISRMVTRFDFVFVSPLGYYLYALNMRQSFDIIKDLAKKCPINLDQAKDFSVYENYFKDLRKVHPALVELQKQTQEDHKFKRI